MQYSETLRNNQAAEVETTIGTAPKLRILTGSIPADCAASETGSLLVEIDLPSDWLGAPAAGVVTKVGTWQDVGVGAGDAGYFRIVENDGTPCHIQGTILQADDENAGDADMTMDNINVAIGQQVTVSAFSIEVLND